MKLRDLVNRVSIDPRKLTEYALHPDHPRGGHKARVFEAALGYNQSNYQSLLDQIADEALESEVIPGQVDQFGQRVCVGLEVTGVEGQRVIVLSVWMIVSHGSEARLATLYPK
ncbi:MAG: hypothetical protein KKD28_15620 [Chloroflexi bacterium]|nr:hypothetical protein [Chloroflexota bacterium]MBU1662886.1 hypothetical protein [Chloroflexota bacterium]